MDGGTEVAGDVSGTGRWLGLAAEPGGELGVEAGVGRDREHRAERDRAAAGLGRQDSLGHGEHPGREFGVEFGGLAAGPGQVSAVGEDLLYVAGQGDAAGDLAPRHLD